MLGVSFSVIILSTHTVIGYIFTTDRETLQVLSEVILLFPIFVILDQMNGVNTGIIKGAGHQFIGALINVICITCIGVPLCMVLVFVCELGIIGIWTGLLIGFALQLLCMLIFIFKINWNTEAVKAMKRAATLPANAQGTEENKENQLEIISPTSTPCNALNKDTGTTISSIEINQSETPKQSEIPTQTEESDFEESHETDPLKVTENVSVLTTNPAPFQSIVVQHTDQGTQTQLYNKLASDITVDPSKLPRKISVLTTNPIPFRKLVFLRATAFIGCILWLCGAVAFNVLYPVSFDQVIHDYNDTLQVNRSNYIVPSV
ncbi:uncharacterized protein [Amphiura filiformis]|uniref:uncharacterized protein n=1 Tax=Amphiura filiformis TaxID=82378 RepID=UPI003B2232F8